MNKYEEYLKAKNWNATFRYMPGFLEFQPLCRILYKKNTDHEKWRMLLEELYFHQMQWQ